MTRTKSESLIIVELITQNFWCLIVSWFLSSVDSWLLSMLQQISLISMSWMSSWNMVPKYWTFLLFLGFRALFCVRRIIYNLSFLEGECIGQPGTNSPASRCKARQYARMSSASSTWCGPFHCVPPGVYSSPAGPWEPSKSSPRWVELRCHSLNIMSRSAHDILVYVQMHLMAKWWSLMIAPLEDLMLIFSSLRLPKLVTWTSSRYVALCALWWSLKWNPCDGMGFLSFAETGGCTSTCCQLPRPGWKALYSPTLCCWLQSSGGSRVSAQTWSWCACQGQRVRAMYSVFAFCKYHHFFSPPPTKSWIFSTNLFLYAYLTMLWYPSFVHRGLVPLHNACSYGHYEVTQLLIEVSASA